MRIGLVLSNPPEKSETFLNAFIEILRKDHELILFVSHKSQTMTGVSQYTYFNKKNTVGNSINNIFQLLYNYKKFCFLTKKSSFKLLIHDIPIWSTKNLDYLHFTFGNLAFGREYYSEVMQCKFSVSFRGSDINVYPKWHNLSYNLILDKCDKIHCNSQQLKYEILKQNDTVEAKIALIHPGLQADYNLNIEEIALLNQNRLTNKSIIFISIGRLHWIKGFELIFEALGKIKKQGIDFEYLLIGLGPDEEKLVFLAHFWGIQNNVKFLGYQKPSEIRSHLEKSNIFIQSSWAEGFSNSTMEAQALGLPVIVTPISGMNELVLHGETGFITKSHGSEDIVNGIKWYFCLSDEKKNEVSLMANQRVRNNFSMGILTKKWQNFFS